MIIWHAPTEPPKEGIELLMLHNGVFGITLSPGHYTKSIGYEVEISGIYYKKSVLAWTEYNMPEWVNSNRKEKE